MKDLGYRIAAWCYYHAVTAAAISATGFVALLVLVAVVLSGCAAFPVDYQKMTAEQIRAAVSDKNANVGCSTVNSPYGRGVVTMVTLDRGTMPNGKVTVDDQCKVTIENQAAPAK